MINCRCDFDSKILGTRVKVDVFLPNPFNYLEHTDDYKKHFTFEPFKTLFALHGAWNTGEQWIENTSILRYAEEAGYALVLPSVENSFYANTLDGRRYEDFMVTELVGFVRGIFPLSDKKEDNGAIGVSMGGYGALSMGFKHPELFSKVAVMSPVVDMAYSTRFLKTLGLPAEGFFGKWKEVNGSKYDLKVILKENVDKKAEFPEVMMIYGDNDDVAPRVAEFAEYAKGFGFEIPVKVYPGEHNWDFWDKYAHECVKWLFGTE